MATLQAPEPRPGPVLLRYRRWLHLREETGPHGWSERADGSIGRASPVLTASDAAAMVVGDGAAGDGSGSSLAQVVNARWSGCVRPVLRSGSLHSQSLHSQSLSSRHGLRSSSATAATGAMHFQLPAMAVSHTAAGSLAVEEVDSDADETPALCGEWGCACGDAILPLQAPTDDRHDGDVEPADYASEAFAVESRLHTADSGPPTPASGGAPRPRRGGGGAADVAAAVQIFLIGQPPDRGAVRRGVARARRAARRAGLAVACAVGGRSATAAAAAAAVVALQAADAALGRAVAQLGAVRSTHSLAFQQRAAHVHAAQARALRWVHELFVQTVPSDAWQSRHYRLYLPEDDQAELDRGFSESVLFAAQALAHGLQIRGTERHTEALVEPAVVLCATWAAVRFAVHARGRRLGRAWRADDAAALRSVLEALDEAWVRFERDLCFAYFGLDDALVAGLMDPADAADADATGLAGQEEEEFSLLVVLLSETLQRARAQGLVSAECIETMDPSLFLALPRLAILHAVSDAVDGLGFGDSPTRPVFWWFRGHAEACRRIHDAAIAAWPPPRRLLLQRMLASDEADVVLARAAAPVLLPIMRSRAETTAAPAPIDLDSIIDSPRTARSLSIDDCISSFYCHRRADPAGDSASDLRLAFKLPLPPPPPLSPPLSRVSTRPPSPASCARELPLGPAAQLAACRELVRNVFVDVCAVADSLHSGPFARPFRRALELVFRTTAPE
ncbi:hypothetical protein H4R21_000732 [Coemansia helicoidea]|uniref:Uncharacterized protein n=1 Tax=Coemansia helicoidea TaxID=1286919 RepID=A0ACC1LES4_9FUNG|nr:hypothetical protein H4R21_000732 [Coemansia helicoidea]